MRLLGNIRMQSNLRKETALLQKWIQLRVEISRLVVAANRHRAILVQTAGRHV